MANPFGLKQLSKREITILRKMAEERFDFFNAVFLDTVLQPFHKKWFEFQFNNPRTLVLGPRASWKCVDLNSQIPVLDGIAYLHELTETSPGKLPFTTENSSTLNSCLGLTKTSQLYYGCEDDVLTFTTEDGFEFSCTPEHKLLCWVDQKLQFKVAASLREDDQVLYKCKWRSFSAVDENPFDIPLGTWITALVFFYVTYPDRWGIAWRQKLTRRTIINRIWRQFNHKDWATIPPEFEEYLVSNGFGSQLLPKPLRFLTPEAARIAAKAFWWINQHIKFTPDQAKQVHLWFLNLGIPLQRVGVTLMHRSKSLRRYFYECLSGEEEFPQIESQLENLADLAFSELQCSSFIPPIVKLYSKLGKKTSFQGKYKKAATFLQNYLQFAPNTRRYSFLFRYPFLLQKVKSIKPERRLVMDLTTDEGNYIFDGVVGHNSTVLDRNYSIWRSLRDPNLRIGIVSKSSLLSSTFVSQIKHVLESNPKIRMVWPDIINPDKAPKWNNSEVTFIRPIPHAEATFTALGVGTTLAGRHFDILIFDDVVDTDCRESPILRKRIYDWFRFVAMQTLSVAEETQAHVIGTLYHNEDLYHQILQYEREGRGEWRSSIQPAINPDGTSFWEESFPLKELQEIEATYGPDVFQLQYQNNPEFGGSGLISWDDFENCYYDETDGIDPERLDLVMGVDLAAPGTDKNATHSSFATVIIGTNQAERKSYVIDIVKRKSLRLTDQRDIIVSRYQEFRNIASIQIESYAVQSYFYEYLGESEIHLPINKVQTGGTKESRHEYVMMLLNNGRLKFKRDLHRELIEEIVNFPNTSADLIDALYLALKGIQREPQIRFLQF